MSKTYSICPKCGALNGVSMGSAQTKKPVCGKCSADLSMHHTVNLVNDRDLAKLIAKSPLPVVVDFWAPWCGPCKSFAPVFENLSKSMADRVVFAKLNTDDNQQSGARHQVRGIPTMIVFKGGQESGRISGALPPQQFAQWLEQEIK